MTNGDTKAIRCGNYLLINTAPDAFVTEGIEITIINTINLINTFVWQVCHINGSFYDLMYLLIVPARTKSLYFCFLPTHVIPNKVLPKCLISSDKKS